MLSVSAAFEVSIDLILVCSRKAVGHRCNLDKFSLPNLPIHSVKEMIDYAKANPGSLTFATGNTAGRTSFSALPSVNGLHKRRRCQETDLDFFEVLARRGRNRCL